MKLSKSLGAFSRQTKTPLTSSSPGNSVSLESGLLVWGQPLARQDWKNSFNVVVGSDLVYDEDCDAHGLVRTAGELLQPNGTLIIGMMSRSEQVEEWFERQMDIIGCDWSQTIFSPKKWRDSKILVYKLKVNSSP